jgi:hypothetical protein
MFDSASVAHLDRALGFEPRGRGFESLRAHHVPLVWGWPSPTAALTGYALPQEVTSRRGAGYIGLVPKRRAEPRRAHSEYRLVVARDLAGWARHTDVFRQRPVLKYANNDIRIEDIHALLAGLVVPILFWYSVPTGFALPSKLSGSFCLSRSANERDARAISQGLRTQISSPA